MTVKESSPPWNGCGPQYGSNREGCRAAMIGLGRMGANMVLEVCGLHCGANGASHFVKMVYDGIEHVSWPLLLKI
jgi:6-phosphogluconate dehydrogenase